MPTYSDVKLQDSDSLLAVEELQAHYHFKDDEKLQFQLKQDLAAFQIAVNEDPKLAAEVVEESVRVFADHVKVMKKARVNIQQGFTSIHGKIASLRKFQGFNSGAEKENIDVLKSDWTRNEHKYRSLDRWSREQIASMQAVTTSLIGNLEGSYDDGEWIKRVIEKCEAKKASIDKKLVEFGQLSSEMSIFSANFAQLAERVEGTSQEDIKEIESEIVELQESIDKLKKTAIKNYIAIASSSVGTLAFSLLIFVNPLFLIGTVASVVGLAASSHALTRTQRRIAAKRREVRRNKERIQRKVAQQDQTDKHVAEIKLFVNNTINGDGESRGMIGDLTAYADTWHNIAKQLQIIIDTPDLSPRKKQAADTVEQLQVLHKMLQIMYTSNEA